MFKTFTESLGTKHKHSREYQLQSNGIRFLSEFYHTRTHDFTSTIDKHLRFVANAGYCGSPVYTFFFPEQNQTCVFDEEVIHKKVEVNKFCHQFHYYI